MIGTLLTGPLVRVWCDDCDWNRVARPADRVVLYRLGLQHVTETDGHMVMADDAVRAAA